MNNSTETITLDMEDVFENKTQFLYHQFRESKAVVGIFVLLYSLSMLVSLGGNSAVVYLVFFVRKMRTVPNVYIANLCISDIIMTILCTPLSVLSNIVFNYWPFGEMMCPIVNYVQHTAVLQRALSLIVLTCNRYNAIVMKKADSKSKIKLIVPLTWLLPSLVCIPTAIHSKIKYMQYEPGSKGVCMEVWPDRMGGIWYGVSIMILQYFLPLLLMIIIYTQIGVIVWKRKAPGEMDRKRDKIFSRSKHKTLKMLLVTVCVYAVSWLPLHTITLVGDNDPSIYDKQAVYIIWLCSHWLSSSNSGTNPIIYGWINERFQSGYKMIMNKLFRHELFTINRFSLTPDSRNRIPMKIHSSAI